MSEMRVLVLGGKGMLGHKLVQVLDSAGYEVFATVRNGLDALKNVSPVPGERLFERVDALRFESVESVIRDIEPDVVINAVGIIKQREEGRDAAVTIEVNSVFPHRLLELTEEIGSRLISVSTDCVYNGGKGSYQESDQPDANDLYGRSKCLGEVSKGNAVTLRTSMIGREIGSPHGLLEWFLANSNGEVRGFTNAFFSGFPTVSLARIISETVIGNRSLRGVYHVSSARISKYDLLVLVKEKYGLAVNIVRDGSIVIDRSLDSARFRQVTGFEPREWDALVEEMRDDPTPYPIWKK